ncbi:hypothetical protein DNL40_15840 [Xylanimonas oleitrophica]|uniref:WXG100 family type VII secretion target n=1 Tax=Xylanimonas oleitrophica TaxID=2607479 RepID=A0A2W5WLJ9_9MICO|nr:hypothetical protein [Xylanimonas oleitrophica]PZR51563.1 hypothetical protein DNL40_15840 [Xylanimonas oleitrophica]
MVEGFRGADVAALRAQAAALHQAAEALVACAARVGAGLQALTWQGQDAERARQGWRQEHVPVLLRCVEALDEATLRLLDDADEQEAVSAAAGSGPATAAAGGAGGPGGTGGPDAAALRQAVDRTHAVVADFLDRYDPVATATGAAAVAHAAARWDLSGASYRTLDQAFGIVSEAHVGPAVGRVTGALGTAGVLTDAYGAYRSHTGGDLHGAVDNGVSAVLGAVGHVPGLNLAGFALGVSWDVGTWAGTQVDEAMAGTRFGDRFASRMDATFDAVGFAGVLATPAALGQTAVEEVALQARDLWRGLGGHGTLDAPRR